MSKINLVPVTILKEDLPGYSSSLQQLLSQKISWYLSLKFNRIIREVQPALRDFDTDRNLIMESVGFDEGESDESKRKKAKEVQSRLKLLLDEDVTVYEVKVSELIKIFPNTVMTSLLVGFGDALNVDVDFEELEKMIENDSEESEEVADEVA